MINVKNLLKKRVKKQPKNNSFNANYLLLIKNKK